MTILLEAVHRIRPITNTAFDRYVDFYGNVALPTMQRHGWDVLGAWKRTGGPMNEDVLLVRFESQAAFEQATRSLFKDTSMAEASGKLRADGITVEESAKLALFAPYAKEQRLEAALAEKPDAPRQYMQAILNLRLGGEAEAFRLLGQMIETIEPSGRIRLTTAYLTSIGKRGELTDLWIMPEGMPSLAYRPGDPLAEIIGPLRAHAPEESIFYLNPLPYSPLQ